jgi:hypothetical protein
VVARERGEKVSMAFDQTTRNRLQRFVNDARRVLEEEFTRQLQNDYGMDPNAGTVAELASLRHINDAQRETARILRDTLAHYTASGDMNAMQGLDRIVREQAFTVLNRLAALRMAEARGLLVESVANCGMNAGFQAKGFQLYARLAGTGLGETGDAYRVYLFSLFDELAQDLPGLFDRYSPQGRLFPREAALLQALNLINDVDIAPLWSEDETIGWIYQYFNSKEERKAMRDASQAPRNSRELAVRNQFFTPRYVVEFLVDNTLGRLWFNATGGATGLRERCQYLLVKPDEAPQPATRLRDPRTLKLLDPACGSMHFGLYAFDLFAEIYREAWAWEQEHGPSSLDHSSQKESTQPQAVLKPLSQTYEDEAAFLRDVPRLIIEHNIYGVDIDPRAAQIASLALWLRAQRAWHDAGVKAKDRPLIGRGHVLAAIAPPAERELRQQFAANLDPRDAELFEKTLQLLKGLPELGVLLQVERELPHLIRRVYAGKGTGLFAQQEQENWQQAESRLRDALMAFAHAAKSTYLVRLFAQDALEALRIIDLTKERFDVVVMNPPFGEPSAGSAAYLKSNYPRSKNDIFAAFVENAYARCRSNGYVGAITARTAFFLTSFTAWRRDFLIGSTKFESMIDLGFNVLDGAMVETAAYVFQKSDAQADRASIFIRLIDDADKGQFQREGCRNWNLRENIYSRSVLDFLVLPSAEFSYWVEKSVLDIFLRHEKIEPSHARVKQGIATGDNERFLRLHSELVGEKKSQWRAYAKGGDFARFYSDLDLYVKWYEDGREIKARAEKEYGSASRTVKNTETFGLPGLTYTLVTVSGFSCRPFPANSIYDMGGPVVFPSSKDISDWWLLLGFLNSKAVQSLLSLITDSRHWHVISVQRLPIPDFSSEAKSKIVAAAVDSCARRMNFWRADETSPLFSIETLKISKFVSADVLENSAKQEVEAAIRDEEVIEREVANAYGIDLSVLHMHTLFSDSDHKRLVDLYLKNHVLSNSSSLLSFLLGCAFGRWDIRYALGEKTSSALPDPFSPLPPCPPAQLQNEFGLPITKTDVDRLGNKNLWSYPILIPWDGILVDDPGHKWNIQSCISRIIEVMFDDGSEHVESKICKDLDSGTLSDLFRKPTGFFEDHLKRYSKGRRQAPIYWPLSTKTGSYTLWVYYPSLTFQTLYTVTNDFVEPKLEQIESAVALLRNKGVARSRDDEKQFEALQTFELELIELRDTLLKLAPTYKPDHDDGVQITAAPLWQLFRHKPWQKVLKDTWTKLEKGDYDWAHLAMNYWPERVREKCKTDKSLAIAHGMEDLYVEPEAAPKEARGRKNKDEA